MTQTMGWMIVGLNVLVLLLVGWLLSKQSARDGRELENRLAAWASALERSERSAKEEALRDRQAAAGDARELRAEVGRNLKDVGDSLNRQMAGYGQLQATHSENLLKQLQALTAANEERLETVRQSVEKKLREIQEDNGKKLEEMRRTVDEKLHATLEKRLGESFKLVSDRLEQVHKGLGEMQTLASGVGDLKRVLTNVKTRGIGGEIQLGNLLEQLLTAEQYEQNVATKAGSNDRVEFAIKLPGRDSGGSCVWLPIDAKFPQEDYQRLLEAQEAANPLLAEEAAKALELRVKSEAKDIAAKYISVPQTTEFAILFLPTEGLYAEVLRRPGLCEQLMREQRIVIAGPTTLGALLNSLQMGFRTLAIERRSSEVWSLLGAVKTEFGKFGDLLDKTGKKLQEASNTIDSAARRSRAIERKLREVQELPAPDAAAMLAGLPVEVEGEE